MKLNKLVIGGGVLVVLLSMLVVGCKQSVDSGNPNWTTDEKDKKVWEQDNSSDKYVRAFKQFGTSFNVTSAVAKLEVADLTTSKAGLVFGLNKYSDSTYQYFVLGVGGNGYTTSKGDYYISYYYDVNVSSLDEANNGQNAPGNRVDITGENNKELNSGVMGIVGSAGTVYVSVKEENKGDSTDTKTVTITIGSAYDAEKKSVSGTIMTETFEVGANATNSGITDPNKKLQAVRSIKGGIGAYGMLKKAENGQTVKAKNTYEVKDFSGTLSLAAEDAE